MERSARILVVDDDPGIRGLVGEYLERSGFRGSVTRLRRGVIAESLSRAHRWSGC